MGLQQAENWAHRRQPTDGPITSMVCRSAAPECSTHNWHCPLKVALMVLVGKVHCCQYIVGAHMGLRWETKLPAQAIIPLFSAVL